MELAKQHITLRALMSEWVETSSVVTCYERLEKNISSK